MPAIDMTAATFQPAHVEPSTRPMSVIEVAAAARRNLLETLPTLIYRQPMVSGKTAIRWHMVAAPSGLKQVLLDKVDNYPKSNITQRLLRPAIGSSMFSAEGEEWRWQRRAAAPIFNPRKIDALAPVMTAAAERSCERLQHAINDGFNGAGIVDVMEETISATFDVVCDALIGAGAPGSDTSLDRREVGEQITRYLETIGRISLLDIVGAPNWIPRPAQLLNRNVMQSTGEKVAKLVATRRAEMEDGAHYDDLVAYLIQAVDPETDRKMDDSTVRNNLMSFIVAGHETTALALAWSLYLLANAPELQERAAAEARSAFGKDGPATYDKLDQAPYLRQVIDEAMRLYPPAAMLSRQAVAPDEILGREIKKGDTVILPIYALHRHDLLWERPMAFDPENFAPDIARQRDRFAYLPFGAGPRICIGMNFALTEAQIILGALLNRYHFAPRPSAKAPRPVLTMTLRPEGGMPLQVSRRR
ncbi:MAG: cytochrome P450 [Neomegalonema sp.]|nr:cytochrome P450 [Neomegalonema sp.]